MVNDMRKILERNGYELWFEINSDTDTYDFWIRKKCYGVMSFCFGLPTSQQSIREAFEIAKNNFDEQAEYYKEMYEDAEE